MSSFAIGTGTLADVRDDTSIVRRLLIALRRPSLEEALSLTAPDVVIETPFIEIWGVEERGHARVRIWLQRMKREWAFVDCYGIELTERAEGCLLGRMRIRGRGKASRNELDWQLHIAARVERDRVVSFGLYLDAEQARNAIGEAFEASR